MNFFPSSVLTNTVFILNRLSDLCLEENNLVSTLNHFSAFDIC